VSECLSNRDQVISLYARLGLTNPGRLPDLSIRRNSIREDSDVHEAENGFDALEKLSDDPGIRLLLTDLAMPEMDGYDLIRSVREKELRYTYIIVLTSIEDRDSLLKALSLGADDYLTKPVFPDELKLRLIFFNGQTV